VSTQHSDIDILVTELQIPYTLGSGALGWSLSMEPASTHECQSIRSHNVPTKLPETPTGADTIFCSGGTWSHRAAVGGDR